MTYSYNVEASDPDAGDTLTYSLDAAPAGMAIDPDTGLIAWTPTTAQVGGHSVTLRVQDASGLSASQSFTVTVTVSPSNHAPTITSTPITAATARQPYRYDVDATDPDAGDVLTFSLTTSPAGMTINAASGLIQWTPTADQIGDQNVTVYVRDQAGGGVDQSYTLSVAAIPPPLNQAPVVISDPAVPRWQALAPLGSLPQLRYGAVSAYTDERDRLVLFGGVDSTTSVFLGDVYIAEHASGVGGLPFWSMVQSQGDANPEARMASTIVYDCLTDSIIAHGGCSENCTRQFADAWLLMNLNMLAGHPIWHQLVSAPTARMDHVAGYDPQTKRMIVYGNASIGSTDIIFNSRQDFPAGIFQSRFDPSDIADPLSVIAVDLNLDNQIDLVTTNFNSNTVSVLLGRQGGAFGDQKTFSTGVEPMQIAAADFNRDGFLDVATANSQDGTLSILLGTGDGDFLPRIDAAFVGGFGPESLAIGDFNLDGNPDIVTRDDGAGGPLYVLIVNGDGYFSSRIAIPINAGLWVAEVASADLNSDGNPDVIAATDSGISALLGRGDGTFQTENDFAITACDTDIARSSLTVGDLNLDGIPDVVVGRPCNAIFVFLGHGK